MSIWRWADRFSALAPAYHVTRGEGETPLVASMRIGPAAGLKRLLFKLETTNPTGSYKDRFAASAMAHMRASGATHVIATSSGNTGSALAAYAAAAGMTCEIAVVEPAPEEKLKQMRLHGARIYKVRGFGIDPAITACVFAKVVSKAARPGSALQISAYKYSPDGMRGVQTISYEIREQAPETRHVFCPAGGGGLVLAVAKGFADSATASAVHCVQPRGNDTIATPLRDGATAGRAVKGTSAISGLQVPGVIDADAAIQCCRASGGTGHVVDDEMVWTVQKRLALEEGLLVEPAAAVSVAGVLQAAKRGEIDPDETIVAVLTGIGFKDQPSIDRMLETGGCPVISLEQLLLYDAAKPTENNHD
jgi:threonine synthase